MQFYRDVHICTPVVCLSLYICIVHWNITHTEIGTELAYQNEYCTYVPWRYIFLSENSFRSKCAIGNQLKCHLLYCILYWNCSSSSSRLNFTKKLVQHNGMWRHTPLIPNDLSLSFVITIQKCFFSVKYFGNRRLLSAYYKFWF